jgi:pimeloyl-ACP methyl ester carboxylesterase
MTGRPLLGPSKEITMSTGAEARNVVLVHGAFVDGSSWRAVYDLLTDDGYHVAVVQIPTLSLSDDAEATRLIIDAQDGPVVLLGHSYGGAVITEAGTP